eukprot:COSAG01_NODE_66_length_29241_cov_17.772768_2_plen_100_part_00
MSDNTGYMHVRYQITLAACYGAVYATPGHLFFRRPAANAYCLFWALFRCLTLAASVMFVTSNPTVIDLGFCVDFVAEALVKPIQTLPALSPPKHTTRSH